MIGCYLSYPVCEMILLRAVAFDVTDADEADCSPVGLLNRSVEWQFHAVKVFILLGQPLDRRMKSWL
jgi:hypothetical protein